MYITRRILAGAKKSWVPSTKGNKETHNIPMHTTDRMYAIEHEPFVPELHRYVTYDKTITIKPTQRTYDRQDIKTPRTVNESLGYFRPSQEQDKVRTLPESNGSTGYVIPQLKRVTFRYCRYSKSSLGVREFIENSKNSGFYEKFLEDNPSTAVYDKIYDDGNSAKILVEWCGKDKTEIFEVSHLSESDIYSILDSAAHRSGLNTFARIENKIHTKRPSIQGQWSIFGSDEEITKRLKRRKHFGKLTKNNAWDPKYNEFQQYYRADEEIVMPDLKADQKISEPRGPYAKPFGPVYIDHNE